MLGGLDLLVCSEPDCRTALRPAGDVLCCPGCNAAYNRRARTVALFPRSGPSRFPNWGVWETLQHNGEISYAQEPLRNLAVGGRPDARAFGRFCQMQGLVLDVGCGPQPWPAYLDEAGPSVQLFGVDPLIRDGSERYTQVAALAEFLPFADVTFDRVLFATSLDHVLDPRAALAEARRVCKTDGQVLIWNGEKAADAPTPAQSPAWYRDLEIPRGAADPFHQRRFTDAEIRQLLDSCGLAFVEHEKRDLDRWRSSHFYRAAR